MFSNTRSGDFLIMARIPSTVSQEVQAHNENLIAKLCEKPIDSFRQTQLVIAIGHKNVMFFLLELAGMPQKSLLLLLLLMTSLY